MRIHTKKTNEKLAHLLSVANLNSGFPAAKYFSCRGLNVMKEALKLSEKKGYLGSKCNRNLRVKNKGNIQQDPRLKSFRRLPETLVLQKEPLFAGCHS